MNEALLRTLIQRYEAASFFVTRRFNALIQGKLPEDITQEQFAIIRYLRAGRESTSTELAEAFCVGKSTITSIATRLVDKGLVQRMPDNKDRRVIYLSLTEKGLQLAEETDRMMEELLGKYIQSFPEEKAMQFIETYEALAERLTGD